MEIKTYLTTRNFDKANRGTVNYIVMHYTANDGDTAMGNAKYSHSAYRAASAHYFVDPTEVVQVVLDKDIAWHCGDNQKYIRPGGAAYKGRCKNNNSIGVEMCSKKINGQYTIPEQTQENAIQLVRGLLKKYPKAQVIRHFDVTGKVCPEPFVDHPEQWEAFLRKMKGDEIDMTKDEVKQMIQREIQEMLVGMDTKITDWAIEDAHKAIKDGLTDGSRPGGYAQRQEMWSSMERQEKHILELLGRKE